MFIAKSYLVAIGSTFSSLRKLKYRILLLKVFQSKQITEAPVLFQNAHISF
jgi:hypothetical protein